ncbi:MAG: biotin/lipoyl-binding protein [Clostridiales bacterium]|nr:biotin/lipoyl-binding protein [Clostridiales bacterium]
MFKKIKFKSKFFWIIIVVALSSSIGFWVYYQMMQTEKVDVDLVKMEAVYASVKDTGTVKSEEKVDLISIGSGKVLEVKVAIGDEAEEGDILVEIDDKALRYQLESLSYEIKALESNISYLIKPYNKSTIENYKDSAKIAKENFDRSKKDYDNAVILFESGAISQSEMDSLELSYKISEMNYSMALNETNAIASGSSQDLIEQYRYQLKSLETKLEMLKDEIDEYVIKAPFDGIISEIYVNESVFVMTGAPTVQIYKKKYFIESNLLEEDLILLNDMTPVILSFDGKEVDGSIRKIHPALKEIISNLGVSQLKGVVEIDVDYAFGLIGREVDIEFIVDHNENSLTISKDTILKYNGDEFVYLVQNGKTVLKAVQIGIKGNQRYEILDGLSEGDIVILNPTDSIEEGMKVSY